MTPCRRPTRTRTAASVWSGRRTARRRTRGRRPITELGLDPALLGKLNTPDRRNPADLPDLGLAYVGQLADVTRAALTAAGVTPQELNSLRRAARRIGGVTPADWYDPTAAAPRSRADCFDCHHHQLAAN